MLKELDAQRLLAVFFLGCLFFNFPLLGLWDGNSDWLGLPLLPTALLALWGLLIAVMGWLMERIEPDALEE